MKIKLTTVALMLLTGTTLFASTKEKKDKTKSFVIERTIPVSANKIWKIVGEEFADIAKSHPTLTSSHYVDGSPMSGEGCERVCKMDDQGKKYTQEKIVNFNEKDQSFKAEITHIGGLPLVADKSYMLYNVDPIDANSCKLTLNMFFLTDPAFMGAMAKGKFKKNIEDYALSIEHHATTGEDVGPNNFKQIKKQYK